MQLIGAHVDPADFLAEGAAREADLVQTFLADPQGWKDPRPREDADAIRASDLALYIHAPYVLNVATKNNRIRIPSRKLLASHAKAAASLGARGLIVHGGHVNAGDDPAEGYANWRKLFERTASDGGFPLPILVENTAGGDNAMVRHFDGLARLWDAIGEFDPGFCLDTCHAHAAGEDFDGIIDRVRAITGRIDLVHANDSKDEFGSGRDRHENLGSGQIDPDQLVATVAAAQAPVVCETPGGAKGQGSDIAFLRRQLAGASAR
jgi:deoxyribonuclease-4